ncbi:MAG: VWA domain-containing protein [Vicinamibacterales bacterium]
MKRLLIALIVAVPLTTLAAPQGQVFHGRTDLVTVGVTVQRGDKPVAGLNADDFEVYDNGVRQVLTDVSYSRKPIDLRLVFDTSGSIDDTELRTYVRAMRQIALSLRPEDRCDIVTFSGRVVEAAAMQAPPVKIDARRVRPDATSFFDAVSLALVTPPVFGRRQLTIVMSDADDNASFFDEGAMIDMARRTDAVVYAVRPITDWHPTDDKTDKILSARLAALTTVTGGRVLAPNHDLDIVPAFLSAIDEFRRSYTLVYTATGVDRGGWHQLSVNIRGTKTYTVRARQGYAG